ncbi:MAG: alpha/beta hydrolase [Anaerolineae bacterium]|nr:MAG: alpha/beta hydrolase [Anaerolineae bacterium]
MRAHRPILAACLLMLAALACNFPTADAPATPSGSGLQTVESPAPGEPTATLAPGETAAPGPVPTFGFPTLTPANPLPAGFDAALLNTVVKNVPYCTGSGQSLLMDVYYPPHPDSGWPAVVIIHGGLWMSGDKSNDVALRFAPALLDAGFLVVSVNYRLAPQYPYPAQLYDVKCAVRHLRANAAEYNIDPERIAALGHSSGGHIAAMLGVTGHRAALDGGTQFNDVSSGVGAVVDVSGISNPTYYCSDSTAQQVFAAANCQDYAILNEANPALYLSDQTPPFLLIHGTADQAVPIRFSEYMEEKLLEAGLPVLFFRVQDAGHSFAEGTTFSPAFAELTGLVITFLDAFMP